MRISLGLLLIATIAAPVALLGCSGDDGGASIRRGSPADVAPADPGATATAGAAAPGAVACPATVPAATALSAQDKNATDVRIVGGVVVYREGATMLKIDPATGARSELYTSPDLVHSFADNDVLVTIESPNPPDAVLKVRPFGATAGQAPPLAGELSVTPDSWSAGGTTVFASDATSFYVLADVTNKGDTIYKVSKANPNVMTMLAQIDGATLGDPQLAGADVWFVRDQKRVYRVAQTDDATDPLKAVSVAGPATEVFGIGYADCKLAVGGTHAFCSTGKALEQRSLTGGELQTVFDAQKVAAPTVLGAALFGADTVFVRSLPSGPTDALKHGIHAVKGTDDKLVACGREVINSLAVDSTSVVWAEQGKGVFRARR